MKKFDVSVIIPTSRADWKTKRAIQSVLEQTLPPRELIVVYDGVEGLDMSEFDTGDIIVKEFFCNLGTAGRTRNKGVSQAYAEYVSFLDCDDYWVPSKLEIQSEYQNYDLITAGRYETSDSADFTVTGLYDTRDKKHFLKNLVLGEIRGLNPSMVVKKSVFDQLGFDTDMDYKEDHLLVYNIYAKGYTHKHLKNPLYIRDTRGLTIRKPVSKLLKNAGLFLEKAPVDKKLARLFLYWKSLEIGWAFVKGRLR